MLVSPGRDRSRQADSAASEQAEGPRMSIGKPVRRSMEETLNAEADRLCNAERYERSEARHDTRTGARRRFGTNPRWRARHHRSRGNTSAYASKRRPQSPRTKQGVPSAARASIGLSSTGPCQAIFSQELPHASHCDLAIMA